MAGTSAAEIKPFPNTGGCRFDLAEERSRSGQIIPYGRGCHATLSHGMADLIQALRNIARSV